jgi:hypothetical protein
MAFGLFSRARNSQSSRQPKVHFGRGRQLRCEALERREMLSVNPVLGVFIHGFSATDQGSGNPGWYASMESDLDSAVLARDAAAGSQITSTVHQSIGPASFSITTVDNTKNVDLEVDWYSGFMTLSIGSVSISTLAMTGSSSTAATLASSIETFLNYEHTTYGTTWDVYLVGYSRGGFVAMHLTEDLQSYVDANPNSISLGYVQETLLDPTGVRTVDVSLFATDTTYVVPSIVDRCINYNDHMNLAPVVCFDGLTMVRSDGSSTGISNVNIKSTMKSYLSDLGITHWYTLSLVVHEESHVHIPEWYVANQLSTDVSSFITSLSTAS